MRETPIGPNHWTQVLMGLLNTCQSSIESCAGAA